jgi:hypothetical protein
LSELCASYQFGRRRSAAKRQEGRPDWRTTVWVEGDAAAEDVWAGAQRTIAVWAGAVRTAALRTIAVRAGAVRKVALRTIAVWAGAVLEGCTAPG